MLRLRRTLRYTDLEHDHWHALCAHLKRFGQRIVVRASLSHELYQWRTHRRVLLKASEKFYETFSKRYWPDGTFGEMSNTRKQQLITSRLKYLLYEMNHQDYHISGTRRRSGATNPAHELPRIDLRSSRLRRSGRLLARSNLSNLADYESSIDTKNLVDRRFFSLCHRDLSGIRDCGSDTEQENEDDEDVDEPWGTSEASESSVDAEEQPVAEPRFQSLRDQLLAGRPNLAPNAWPKQRVLRKPLADRCGICQSSYEPLDDTIWCKYGCGHSVHSECFDQWKETQEKQASTPTCVYCRRSWPLD